MSGRLATRNVFSSIAWLSLPSKKTNAVPAEKTVAGLAVSKASSVHPHAPKALSMVALFVVLPHGFPILDLM